MNDPSDGVASATLLRNIHLVSTYAYAVTPNVSLETIANRLVEAPEIVGNVKPMVWMFIDCPADGVMMLCWQPLAKRNTDFASDGYVWLDAETAFSSQTNGYQDPNRPAPDPSLWIIHYSRADPANHFPAARAPLNPTMQSILTERRFLQQSGQLIRKEFMLHDRNSWPTINPPGSSNMAAYPNNVISHMRQQSGYVQPPPAANNQPSFGPPPAKRQRQTITNPAQAENAVLQAASNTDATIDEEDVSRGDMFDFLTPRDISAARYKQHHEWLGEVFRSPYDTQQIVPGELGLGRKGELEALTKDFFNAPTEASSRTTNGGAPARVGRMEIGQAEEFSRLANDRIASIQVEIEKMKKQHAKRMAKLAKGAELREMEKILRGSHIGEDRARAGDEPNHTIPNGRNGDITAIQSDVEGRLRKKIIPVKDMECIQKGSLSEKANESEEVSQNGNFSDQSGALSGQIPAFDTPQDQLSSMGNTPGLSIEQAQIPNTTSEPPQGDEGSEMPDVAMSGMQHSSETKEVENEEWIMVDKEGEDSKATQNEELPDLDAFTNDAAIGSNAGTPGNGLSTAAEGLPDFSAASEGELGGGFEANDFTEGVDFGHLDSTGEALSGFGAEESMGMDDSVDLGLDDSAFGDAFHGTEADAGRDNHLDGS
ncbi:MAG: hypothetical protein Q9174_002985 [Haloplaca sp. 1 TL-2023]